MAHVTRQLILEKSKWGKQASVYGSYGKQFCVVKQFPDFTNSWMEIRFTSTNFTDNFLRFYLGFLVVIIKEIVKSIFKPFHDRENIK